MLGLMMDRPLLISQLIEHAAEYHGDDEIVSWSVEGLIHRHTCADAARRSGQLAKALEVLGADTSLSGARLAGELTSLIGLRGKPHTVIGDNGTELTSSAILCWSQERLVEWR
ncbi:MAG: hypothetical protein K2Y17_00740 [Qipengyuania sp.]|jgi:hypothetical protein|nr:hypothetical protein [Qipengyuania sp.]